MGRPNARLRRIALRCAAAAWLGVALPAAADFRVGAGATTPIASARFDLACTDLVVAGRLNLDSGTFVNVRDVIVQPGGQLFGGTGSITLSRNFTVIPNGQFIPESSTILYDTNCGPGASPTAVPTLDSGLLPLLAALVASLALLARRRIGVPKRNTDHGVGR